MDLLDNPVWHALTGPHQKLAEGHPPALRYQRDVALFSALPDAPGAGAWRALRALAGPGGFAALVRADGIAVPDAWSEVGRYPCVQMVATAVAPASADRAVALGPDDVGEMLALVARTEPGPFLSRTIELGDYLGVRDDGELVAMAGERVHLAGYTEISAVCTDPVYRGRGLASMLVRDLVGRIMDRHETPILHAMADNTAAIRLYRAMGFAVRAEFDVVLIRAAPGD